MNTDSIFQIALITAVTFAFVSSCEKPGGINTSTTDNEEVLKRISSDSLIKLEKEKFPFTPLIQEAIALPQELSLLSDEELAHNFDKVDDVERTVLLNEIKRRGTPKLASVLVQNIDRTDFIAILSGEAMYVPELRYPIASALVTFGKIASSPLVKLILNKDEPLNRRVLAIRTLLRIDSSITDRNSDFRKEYLGDSEIEEFLDVLNVAVDEDRLAIMFPFALEQPMR